MYISPFKVVAHDCLTSVFSPYLKLRSSSYEPKDNNESHSVERGQSPIFLNYKLSISHSDYPLSSGGT